MFDSRKPAGPAAVRRRICIGPSCPLIPTPPNAHDYLESNPAEHSALPRDKARGRAKIKHAWTVEELQSWLRQALGDRFAGMWALAAPTGMRRFELAGVHRDHLDLDNGALCSWDTRVVVHGHAQDSAGKTDASDRKISLDTR
jgi:integrase